jgi:type II secretory pathway component PulK
MKKRTKNQSGIALMIVLSAITLLTAITTEFAYNTNVNYHLAMNEKERIQAYFLAESAIELMKLELKLEKQLRSNISASPVAGAISANLSGPLCQQFPLSTALIRSMVLGQGEGGEEGVAEEAFGEETAFVSGLQIEAAEDFLNFEGDFEGTCQDEGAKFNINTFFGKDPAAIALSGLNDYDKVKQLMVVLLSQPEFKNLFPAESERKVNEIVRNIADWVDKNDRINEPGGSSAGSESSFYPAGLAEYEVKNGKYLTLDEIYMVAEVKDDWFTPIRDRFTVYGDGKLNVCVAPDVMIAALILQYANSNANLPNIDPRDKERMSNLVSVVQNGCTGVNPSVSEIANALNAALTATAAASATTPGGGGASSGAGFSNLITTKSRYYSLKGTGIVGDTEVNIRAVLDTKEAQPRKWKLLYWRVE